MSTKPTTATPADQILVEMLGGYRHEGTTFTPDQMRQLRKVYGFDPQRSENKVERLLQAGSDRNLMREVTNDGLRVMAFLASHMEPGQDPVRVIHDLCRDAGWDMDDAGFDEQDEEQAA